MSNESQSARRCVLLILSLVVFALAAQFSAYTGLIASDDLGYSRYANQIANGTYHLEHHHYAIRYGVLLPVAALYHLFGLQEWTTVFFPMLCSCISPALAALIAWQMAGWRAAWITGVLMATFAVRVRYASILVPEPILMTMLLLAALVYLQAEKRNSAILALAAGMIFGGAYLTKEPGIFVGMAFGAFALIQRRWRIAFYLAAGCALVILGEMSWYFFESGDPLFRLHAMAAHNASPAAIAANTDLAYRIWKEYPRMMLLPNNNFGIHSLFALWLAVMAVWLWRSCHKSLLLLWVALPYLFLNFGTTNFSHYWALPSSPRYLIPIYPPLFILAAIAIEELILKNVTWKWTAYPALAAVCAVGVGCAIETRDTGYRTPVVVQLKKIAATARHANYRVCEFKGPEGLVWRQAFGIVASDEIGCSTTPSGRILPDSTGLPSIAILSLTAPNIIPSLPSGH